MDLAYLKFYTRISLILVLTLFLTFRTISLLSFYFFFECSLIPISLIIMGWGYQPERLRAAFALIVYTVSASLPLLLLLSFILKYYTKDFLPFLILTIYSKYANINLFIVLTFLVKFPMYIVHLWLPKAHVEAPVEGSILLAALLLKLGGYGIYRVMLVSLYSKWIVTIQRFSLIGGLIISILCVQQTDIKVLIAYSSIGHISLAISCLIIFTKFRVISRLYIIIVHGFSSSAIFLRAYYIYLYSHSRNILLSRGLLSLLPIIVLAFFLSCLANMAAPPFFNLFAEIWAINALVDKVRRIFFILVFLCILPVGYTLILYSSVSQGQKINFKKRFLLNPIKLILVFLPHAWFFIFVSLIMI